MRVVVAMLVTAAVLSVVEACDPGDPMPMPDGGPDAALSLPPLCLSCGDAQPGAVKDLWCSGTLRCQQDSMTVVCHDSVSPNDLRAAGCMPIDGAIDGFTPACCGGTPATQNQIPCNSSVWDDRYMCMQSIETGAQCWYGQCLADGFCGLGPFPTQDFPNGLCEGGAQTCVQQVPGNTHSVACQIAP